MLNDDLAALYAAETGYSYPEKTDSILRVSLGNYATLAGKDNLGIQMVMHEVNTKSTAMHAHRARHPAPEYPAKRRRLYGRTPLRALSQRRDRTIKRLASKIKNLIRRESAVVQHRSMNQITRHDRFQ